jgi:hypothetical protein
MYELCSSSEEERNMWIAGFSYIIVSTSQVQRILKENNQEVQDQMKEKTERIQKKALDKAKKIKE